MPEVGIGGHRSEFGGQMVGIGWTFGRHWVGNGSVFILFFLKFAGIISIHKVKDRPPAAPEGKEHTATDLITAKVRFGP